MCVYIYIYIHIYIYIRLLSAYVLALPLGLGAPGARGYAAMYYTLHYSVITIM